MPDAYDQVLDKFTTRKAEIIAAFGE